jgi:hypothetical protein
MRLSTASTSSSSLDRSFRTTSAAAAPKRTALGVKKESTLNISTVSAASSSTSAAKPQKRLAWDLKVCFRGRREEGKKGRREGIEEQEGNKKDHLLYLFHPPLPLH